MPFKTNSIFSDIQMNLLKAGESSGKLDEILQKITFDLERNNFISKVRGALIYPSLILFTTIVVMWVLMIYMMPSIANLFLKLRQGENSFHYSVINKYFGCFKSYQGGHYIFNSWWVNNYLFLI